MDDEGIFGSWESWVKYGGNMEGVGKYVGMWGEVRESVRRCVKVVESVLGWGQSVLGWGWCWERGGGVQESAGRNVGQSG